MALYLSSYLTFRDECKGEPFKAVALCDDKAAPGARVVCSLPARLNGGEIPSLRALRGILRGDSILANADEAIRAVRAQRKTVAYEFVSDCHMGRVMYNDACGDYFARIYEVTSNDDGSIGWTFYDSLGLFENLFDAIGAIQKYFGIDAPEENNPDRAEMIDANRARAAMLRDRQARRALRDFYSLYAARRALGSAALEAYRMAQVGTHFRVRLEIAARGNRHAVLMAEALARYNEARPEQREFWPARATWGESYQAARLNNPRPL